MPAEGHRRTVTALLGSLALLAVSSCSTTPSAGQGSPRAADPAPAISCDELDLSAGAEHSELPPLRLPCLADGPEVALAGLTGRPTLINLWASWCAPCREEMPLIEEAFERNGHEIRFLGVVTRDDADAAGALAADLGIRYPHAVDQEGALLDFLGVPGLPVTLAVGANGRIVKKQIGQMTPRELTALTQALLASAPPTGSTE